MVSLIMLCAMPVRRLLYGCKTNLHGIKLRI
uniref:Aspartic proteinase oryzasin-1 n=1 Tax=Arundo donax TaxID=35708 RepID=A0A0A9EE43_ARUDO